MRKKLVIFILGLALLSGLTAGCSRRGGNADVHVFYYTYSDTYISTVRSALDRRLKDAGISYQDYDANNSQTTQTEQIQTAVTKGAKLLVVNIVTTGSDDAATGILSLARSAGIPVIFFNREVSDGVVNSYENCIYVGTNATEAGELQGDMIGDFLVRNFEKTDLNKDGKISYVMFMGEKGNNEAIYRTRYSVENANKVLSENGKPPLEFYDPSNADKFLLDKDGKWSAQAANEYMTTALTTYNAANNNMIELVICNNDNMAEGAITALQGAGFNTGAQNSVTIPVFGVDAIDAAKSLIRDGKMAGTITQDGGKMAECIEVIVENALAGDPLAKDIGDYTVDETVAKVRIPYGIYTGESNG
ncbi:MAG: galactose ABC transporter substrate-binding protein [Clostridia bacterium]|nr:galactose ABC transporter substrate-binding protein [Clostridia bacterium]